MIDIATWEPGVRLGEIVFDTPLGDLGRRLGLVWHPAHPDDVDIMTIEEFTTADREVSVYTYDGDLVHGVMTKRSVLYKGRELLGLTAVELGGALGAPFEVVDPDTCFAIAACRPLGARFWLRDDLAYAATLTSPLESSEE